MMKKLMKPLFFDHQHGHHHHHENHKQKMMNCVRGKLGEKKKTKEIWDKCLFDFKCLKNEAKNEIKECKMDCWKKRNMLK